MLMLISAASVPASALQSGPEIISFEKNSYTVDYPAKSAAKALLKGTDIPDTLPSKYNTADKGIFTPAKDQGIWGTCWAFASLSALETDAVLHGISSAGADFSEAHLAWFAYSAAQGDDPLAGEGYTASDPFDEGGNWARSTGTLARWSGAANEADYPYGDGMGNYSESDRYDRSSGVIIRDTEILTSDSEVKQWIMEHGSCTAAMLWYNNYENTATSSYYYSGTSSNINHMITIVGWDDDYPSTNFSVRPQGKGAWIVRDSNGADFHDNGYFMLSYYDRSLSSFAGFTAQSADNFDKNYTYNAIGFSPCVYKQSGSKAANVFTASGNEELRAVSFYTGNADTRITAEIYTGLSSSDPTSGTLAASAGKTYKNQGYFTLELPEPVTLKPGERFSVVLTYSGSGSNVYIPVERLNSTYDGTVYRCDAGRSYCLFKGSGSEWQDAVDCDLGNFFIQAFTVCTSHYAESGEITVRPSCKTDGAESSVCVVCGEKFTQTVPALGHDYATAITLEPGCLTDGNMAYECTRCGDAYNEKIPAVGHTYSEEIVPPTCCEEGYTLHTCRCGESYRDSFTEPSGHIFTNYIYNCDADYGTDGTETAKCDRCDAFDTRTAAGTALAHAQVEIKSFSAPFPYRETIVFTADYSNACSVEWHCTAPEWHIDADGRCMVENPRTDFEISCSVTDAKGEKVSTGTQEVPVKHTFFAKLIWLFRKLFGLI